MTKELFGLFMAFFREPSKKHWKKTQSKKYRELAIKKANLKRKRKCLKV